MTIQYECEHCGSKLNIKDDKAGQQGKCPKCSNAFTIPQPESSSNQPAGDEDFYGLLSSDEDEKDKKPEAIGLIADLTDDEDSEEDIIPPPPAPAPKETSKDVDVATASGLAGDLLSKTGKKTRPDDWIDEGEAEVFEKRRDRDTGEAAEAAKYLAVKGLPIIGGAVFLIILAYIMSARFLVTPPEYPPLAEVSGVVTVDGEPLARAALRFIPFDGMEPGSDISDSFGRTDEKGHYELTYVKDVKGAYIGKHRVVVREHVTSKVRLPSHYNMPGDSVLTFDVKKDGNENVDWKLSAGP